MVLTPVTVEMRSVYLYGMEQESGYVGEVFGSHTHWRRIRLTTCEMLGVVLSFGVKGA
jgi:hypothetical protein